MMTLRRDHYLLLITTFITMYSPIFSRSKTFLPMELHEIPFADQQGIILDVKEIQIRDIGAPYNAALTQDEIGDYLLFFRYDVKEKGSFKHNYIACVALDKRLEQKTDFIDIDTGSDYSNDPRVLKAGSQHFLVYNDTISRNTRDRVMKIGALNISNFQLNFITDLDRNIKKTEKNWIPFSYQKESLEKICFIYTIEPYDILTLENPQENSLKNLRTERGIGNFPWKWGVPRGGTPAELVDGEYLTFFHSSFKDNYGNHWYVFGAFTFEATPPFKITAVSPHPILFKEIYNSPHLNGSSSRLRCIFPSGIVLTEDNSKILVSCGENDSTVKIITFDKEALLKSLKDKTDF